MKPSFVFLLTALLALPLGVRAADLPVNAAPIAGPLTNDQTFDIDTLTIDSTTTVLITADVTFTRPTGELAAVDEYDKVTVAARADGQLVIWNGSAWLEFSGVTIPEEGGTKTVSIVANRNSSELTFKVTVGTVTQTITTTITSSNAESGSLRQLAFTGEGSVANLSLAAATPANVPLPEGSVPTAEQTAAYADWIADGERGGALPDDATQTERQDAFLLNVGGKPKLAITAIDPLTRTITIAASYEATDGNELPADLDDINGTLYITYATELGGPTTSTATGITIHANGTATYQFPEGARFLKARVSLVEPSSL